MVHRRSWVFPRMVVIKQCYHGSRKRVCWALKCRGRYSRSTCVNRRFMTRFSLALCGLVLAALASTSALADTVSFSFSFSNSDFSGSGVLTADLTSVAGVYQVVGTTGSVLVNGVRDQISKVLPVGDFPVDGPNDNLLYFPELSLPQGAFDASGVSFSLANGAGKLKSVSGQRRGPEVDWRQAR